MLATLANLKNAPLRVAIIGASGGVGSGLIECLDGDDNIAKVYALSRNRMGSLKAMGKTHWLPIDLLEETSIERAAAKIGSEGALDIVIIASGILHGEGLQPEKDWRMLDAAAMGHIFAVNTIGPALVMKHFAPILAKDGRAVMASLSARVGSISDNRLGGWYSYRASKAALNQIIKTFSIELSRKNKAAVVLGLHPGTVATGLSEPYQANAYERFTPIQSAQYLLSVIDKAEPSMTGRIYDWKGELVPE